MKAVVAAFNQEKALVGAFSVITNLRMELFKHYWAVVGRANYQELEWRLLLAADGREPQKLPQPLNCFASKK